MYIKNDMKAKFRFLHELEAAVGKEFSYILLSRRRMFIYSS